MKRLSTAALAATCLLALAPAGSSAAPKPKAEVLGIVAVDGDTATVRARYVCYSATHLWVSAKQTESGDRDPALQEEGSSGAAANWMDSNTWTQQGPISDAGDFTCDGRSHTDSFTIRTSSAPWGSWGALEDGFAWVQFCLTEEAEEGEFVVAERWVRVR